MFTARSKAKMAVKILSSSSSALPLGVEGPLPDIPSCDSLALMMKFCPKYNFIFEIGTRVDKGLTKMMRKATVP